MQKIFITRHIPEAGLKLLRKNRHLKLDIYKKDKIIPRRTLLRRVRGVDIILSILTEKIDAAVMDAAGLQLKMIANYGVGFDNIDLVEAKKRGIIVTNTPGPEITEAVAEHVIALMFALAHRLITVNKIACKNKYKGWGPELLLGNGIGGSTLGIVGGGAIGSALAKHLRDGFNLKILYHDVKKNIKLEAETGAIFCPLSKLLKQSDFVTIHVPLLPSTHHLIGATELSLMKKSAFLINTARGPIVDEAALVHALQNNLIAGAGLDVYEHEPRIPRTLRKLSNVVLTPHTASATNYVRNAMSVVAATNIIAFIQGNPPPNALH
jgi:glyoxylate reductase